MTAMTATVHVGLLGLGIVNTIHRRNLLAMPDVRVTALWDPLPEHARAVAAEVGGGCRVFEDYGDLIDRAGVDCLFIAVPPHRHEGQETLAARKGLPFLVEKPVVRDLAQGWAIEREIARSGVLHAVGYHNRYAPHCDAAREALAGAVVGTALGFTYWKSPTEQSQPRWHHWLFDDAQGGGQLHEHTTHVFDLARHLVGEVQTVYCERARRLPHAEITGYATADVHAVTLRFRNGAVGLVGAGHMTPRAYWWGLHVLADRCILEYNERRLRVLGAEGEREVAPDLPHGLHAFQDAAFVRAVRAGDRSLVRSTYADALRTAAVSLAALESAATGAPVAVEAVLERSRAEAPGGAGGAASAAGAGGPGEEETL